MNIITNEKYEGLAAEWQFQMLTILKNTLKEYQVENEKSKEICGQFAFDLSMLQDQGEIIVNGKSLRPVICFENKNNELFYNSSDDFQLHDYAFGNTEELFNQENS